MAMHKIIILSFTILSVCCLSSRIEPSHFNRSSAILNGGLAKATWYGNPSGDGTDGGACGYKNIVSQPPYSSLVTAVGPSLYKDGESCGECYQVSCDQSQNPACSGKPVRIVITDFCPNCLDGAHFDLSGTAFGALAVAGQEAQLRNAGALQINYERVPCQYGNTKISFRVDEGSNPEYLAVAVEFEDGDGDLGGVALSQGGAGANSGWEPMQHSWGAVWKFQAGSGTLQGPFSIRLTSMTTGKTVEADNAIPAGWKPGSTYQSSVNF